MTYQQMNQSSRTVEPGSDGLFMLPFGNGAERMLNNKRVHAHVNQIDFNKHGTAHLFRAAQEGIAFAFRYGLDIMRENGMNPNIIRASKANLFFSDVFTESFVNTTNVAVEFYEGDGSYGAAIGAGIGAGFFADSAAASRQRKPISVAEPQQTALYEELYCKWKELLEMHLIKSE
jgi:xylulokinase